MPIISVEPRIRWDSSARLTPPIAATSLMSLSPLRPANEEANANVFFSLEASLGAEEATKVPLTVPSDAVDAVATGRVAALEVEAVDVDATVIKGDAPVVGTEDTDVPAGGRVMVKERGVVPSVAPEGSVLIVDAAVMVVDAPVAADVAITLGACWAALALGTVLLAAGRGGRGEETVPAEAPTIEGT